MGKRRSPHEAVVKQIDSDIAALEGELADVMAKQAQLTTLREARDLFERDIKPDDDTPTAPPRPSAGGGGQCDKAGKGNCTGVVVAHSCTRSSCSYVTRRCERHGGNRVAKICLASHRKKHDSGKKPA